jgi:hypothetical protein
MANVRTIERTQNYAVITNGNFSGGGNYTTGQKMYLGPIPYLFGKNVKGLRWTHVHPNPANEWFITLVNRKGEKLLDQFPLYDLTLQADNVQPRLFNLYDIDSQKSYLEQFSSVISTYLPGVTIGRIDFLTNYGS